MSDATIDVLGDACLTIRFDERIDPAINRRCIAIATAIAKTRGIRDVVPAYHTVTVHFDPLGVNREELRQTLSQLSAAEKLPSAEHDEDVVEVPVRYGGDAGPDLSAVAAFAKCSEDDVVRLHTAPTYRVYMLGFLPGFAYLGSVDSRIAMPRRDTPRMKVAAGSVAIAGSQTAVYPCDTPGGWRIIGRAAVAPFDLDRERASFHPGQSVKFVAA